MTIVTTIVSNQQPKRSKEERIAEVREQGNEMRKMVMENGTAPFPVIAEVLNAITAGVKKAIEEIENESN